MDKVTREKYINLCFSGGDIDLAFLLDPTYTLDDYEKAFQTKEYETFAAELQERFIAGAEVRIIGNLYRAEAALKEIRPEHKNYPAIMRNYKELLQLTSPIIERMHKIVVESNAFEGLELVIKGVGKGSEEE